MSSVACVRCGVEFEFVTAQRKYCSAECREARPKSKKASTQVCTCVNCGKSWSRPTVRGQRPKWCADCKFISEKTCERCGVLKPISTGSVNCTSCWSDIQVEAVAAREAGSGMDIVSCMRCEALFVRSGKANYCSTECSGSPKCSDLRVAYESGDHRGVIESIRLKSTVDEAGCWLWQGRVKKGYAEVTLGGKWRAVHRLSLEAKLGKPLGSQQAHHICANSTCVNPEHLQPATYAENIAEMKARQSYLDRIRELEAALAESDPDHPLLNVAGYALVG